MLIENDPSSNQISTKSTPKKEKVLTFTESKE
jgi:hypothetical protein